MSDAITALVVPSWGATMTEGKVNAWHVDEGAEVKAGDEVLDVESDKIASPMEAPVAGRLRRRLIESDEMLPVGTLLGVIADAGVSDADIDAFIEAYRAEHAGDAAQAEAASIEAFRLVEVGGQSIRDVRRGEADRVVVLVHGFGGGLDNWLFNIDALAAVATVYALDLPGHGGSGRDVGDGSASALAATLAGFLDGVGVAQAHFVGHSMGGAVVQRLALDAPDRVAGLALVCSAALGEGINGDYIDGFVAAGNRRDIKESMQMLFADPDLVTRQMVADMLEFKRADGVDAALAAIAASQFAGGRQQQVLIGEVAASHAVLAVFGDQDQVIPVEQAQALPKGVRVHVVEGAGHLPQMEAAGVVNGLLLDWLG